jgi:hypothetical protein
VCGRHRHHASNGGGRAEEIDGPGPARWLNCVIFLFYFPLLHENLNLITEKA